jgi:hypothetical protein
MKPALANIGSSAYPKSVLDYYFYPPDEMRAMCGEGINLSLGYFHSEIFRAVAA